MVAGYRAPIESTLVVAETEFEPTTNSVCQDACVSKGKAKSAGGQTCTILPQAMFFVDLAA